MDFEFSDQLPVQLTELGKAIGQMFLVGFAEDYVTDETRELITKYHIGSIMLRAKNLRDAETTRNLILELQQIAHDAGHEHPLLIAIDQENGMLNNLNDEEYLSQFPGPMAIVATKSLNLARQVAHATGQQLKSLGVNWLLGPVLDVLTNSTNRLLGVRTMGDDAQEVTRFSLAFMEGYESAGICQCGKHFPGYGNATVDSTVSLPVVPESIEQLETSSLIPFREAIKANIDAIMVGGCALPKIAMNEMHACLSERVVRELLREDMGYDGVIVSECLEMDALYENVGVRQGAVMTAIAGCDVVLVCSSYRLQIEAISGIFGAVTSGILEHEAIYNSAKRVAKLKSKHLSWQEALNPKPLSYLKELKKTHLQLSKTAYQQSITLVRDHSKCIPLSESIERDSDIVLLTPLVTPLVSTKHDANLDHLLLGENVFQEFGRSLARLHTGKVLHASYTANGVISMHDQLIERAQAVIIVTTDAHRNMYQVGFTKHVGIICAQQRKPVIAIAASSPYDLALDRAIGTYLCLYEFTNEALDTTAKVLFGQLPARGHFPGSGLYQRTQNRPTTNGNRTNRNKWLVEKWSHERDMKRLKTLWENCFSDRHLGPGVGGAFQLLLTSGQTHFIVRNSSTNNLYGFCATWVYEKQGIGCIAMIFVEPSRRGMSIGRSLHDRAVKYLIRERNVSSVKIGCSIPSFFHGIPTNNYGPLMKWFQEAGWVIDVNLAQVLAADSSDTDPILPQQTFNSTYPQPTNSISHPHSGHSALHLTDGSIDLGDTVSNPTDGSTITVLSTMLLTSLSEWSPSKTLIRQLEVLGIKFDICLNEDRFSEIMAFANSPKYAQFEGLTELYREALSSGDSKIIVALDPVKKTVVGSIILFTRGSSIASYMPWIVEFEDARVGGLCGVITDPQYNKELESVFNCGLVGCGVRQFKLQGFERCVIDRATGHQAEGYAENGFYTLRRYLQVSNVAQSFVV
ncbi:hypothetical protein AWJ20_4023 [Sugiyamaella lignohabitans]|uniref:Uncharacterized protein n=1 Tax=Sugiyamaella lignohabitans TaxID=796027 RepID=A0A161HFD8_9ASCO|nr:uncharacterized protein AWJ20_4023 [Sugiyamaella lignohabitans]ANB11221.1 hypothetical protein AWJ20_4023 [Sugiyamaella lignohabitans]